MGQTNDIFWEKVHPLLAMAIKDIVDQNTIIGVIVRTIDCENEKIVNELASAGLGVNSSGPRVVTGSIAIRDLKKLVALSCVVQVQAPQQLRLC